MDEKFLKLKTLETITKQEQKAFEKAEKKYSAARVNYATEINKLIFELSTYLKHELNSKDYTINIEPDSGHSVFDDCLDDGAENTIEVYKHSFDVLTIFIDKYGYCINGEDEFVQFKTVQEVKNYIKNHYKD